MEGKYENLFFLIIEKVSFFFNMAQSFLETCCTNGVFKLFMVTPTHPHKATVF